MRTRPPVIWNATLMKSFGVNLEKHVKKVKEKRPDGKIYCRLDYQNIFLKYLLYLLLGILSGFCNFHLSNTGPTWILARIYNILHPSSPPPP